MSNNATNTTNTTNTRNVEGERNKYLSIVELKELLLLIAQTLDNRLKSIEETTQSHTQAINKLDRNISTLQSSLLSSDAYINSQGFFQLSPFDSKLESGCPGINGGGIIEDENEFTLRGKLHEYIKTNLEEKVESESDPNTQDNINPTSIQSESENKSGSGDSSECSRSMDSGNLPLPLGMVNNLASKSRNNKDGGFMTTPGICSSSVSGRIMKTENNINIYEKENVGTGTIGTNIATNIPNISPGEQWATKAPRGVDLRIKRQTPSFGRIAQYLSGGLGRKKENIESKDSKDLDIEIGITRVIQESETISSLESSPPSSRHNSHRHLVNTGDMDNNNVNNRERDRERDRDRDRNTQESLDWSAPPAADSGRNVEEYLDMFSPPHNSREKQLIIEPIDVEFQESPDQLSSIGPPLTVGANSTKPQSSLLIFSGSNTSTNTGTHTGTHTTHSHGQNIISSQESIYKSKTPTNYDLHSKSFTGVKGSLKHPIPPNNMKTQHPTGTYSLLQPNINSKYSSKKCLKGGNINNISKGKKDSSTTAVKLGNQHASPKYTCTSSTTNNHTHYPPICSSSSATNINSGKLGWGSSLLRKNKSPTGGGIRKKWGKGAKPHNNSSNTGGNPLLLNSAREENTINTINTLSIGNNSQRAIHTNTMNSNKHILLHPPYSLKLPETHTPHTPPLLTSMDTPIVHIPSKCLDIIAEYLGNGIPKFVFACRTLFSNFLSYKHAQFGVRIQILYDQYNKLVFILYIYIYIEKWNRR